jgi:hypothetical protein
MTNKTVWRKEKSFSRREFLAAGGTFAIGTPLALTCAAPAETPFNGRRSVNPDIDNLSVVCGINAAMVKADPSSWEMEGQNIAVDAAQVEKTLDAMAMAIASSSAADAAWTRIFRKPTQKEWATVKAAIKVNCIAINHPRIAVVNKICLELLRLGIPAENIIIYDGCHNAAQFYSTSIGKGLPSGVQVSDKYSALGGTMKTPIPAPKKGEYSCAKALVDGSIDLLINIAVNKGHNQGFGGTTLTMKNHAGTFDPKPLHIGGGMDYLIAFNKSDAIRGKDSARQQLCIIDSLWGAQNGPGGPPDKRLDRLVMGTFSPAIDYLTAKKIREPELKATHSHIERFITEFGYRVDEMPEMKLVKV